MRGLKKTVWGESDKPKDENRGVSRALSAPNAKRIFVIRHALNDELPPPQAPAKLSAMKTLPIKDEEFATDANGKRVGVLLDVKTYEHLCEAEEELADIRAYDTARPKVAAKFKVGQCSTLADYQARRSD